MKEYPYTATVGKNGVTSIKRSVLVNGQWKPIVRKIVASVNGTNLIRKEVVDVNR